MKGRIKEGMLVKRQIPPQPHLIMGEIKRLTIGFDVVIRRLA